jgi:curved DNA-binding protein CbpA
MRIFDSYKILQISVGADMDEIKAAYKRLCRENHPDLNPGQEFEERMKDINVAYSTLRDDLARRQKLRVQCAAVKAKPFTEEELACNALRNYFDALVASDYSKAYAQLSRFDKSRISPSAFAQWRECVETLYSMLNFSIGDALGGATITLHSGGQLRAKRFSVCVTERDKLAETVQTEQSDKLAVYEGGVWRVFLGYADLDRLTGSFREKLEEDRKKQFERDWQLHRENNDPDLGVLSVKGLLAAAKRPVYEFKRHKRPFVLSAIHVRPVSSLNKNASAFVMRSASDAIKKSIRLTDEVAFADPGVFVVLLSNMKKRSIPAVSHKLESALKEHILASAGERAQIRIDCIPYSGEDVGVAVDTLIKKVVRMG